MADARQYYTPSFLRGEDLINNPTEVTIRNVGAPDDYKKVPVYFTDGRSIKASGRNLEQLTNITDTWEMNDWPGHTVLLAGYKFDGTDRTTGEVKEMFAINVKRSDKNTKENINAQRDRLKSDAANRRQESNDALDDQIPF